MSAGPQSLMQFPARAAQLTDEQLRDLNGAYQEQVAAVRAEMFRREVVRQGNRSYP